jgi:hypothetical protein
MSKKEIAWRVGVGVATMVIGAIVVKQLKTNGVI